MASDIAPMAKVNTGKTQCTCGPSTATRKYRNMKARLRPHGGVANPRDSYGYRCGLRLALGANPSLSSCSDTSVSLY
jgi:hypothetical protein